jgi:putative ABC transport system ATP-binding protein
MAIIIEAAEVRRVFRTGGGPVEALRGVSLGVPGASLTVLRGPSGSGKTTLVNILGGLDLPTSGSVRFDGVALSALGETGRDALRRTSMGFVFQSLALVAVMSAFENVEFALRVAGCPGRDRRRRTEECLALVGLRRRMDHRPHEMSGGEQQRVAIARAIAHRPKVVFADEPTAELDTHTGVAVVKLFRDLVASAAVTVVMTTHDPQMIELADRVFTLEDGMVVDER